MNILYGVQATGNGHISRSREIIRCLKKRGHNVFVILSGREPESLWDMEDFRPFTTFKGLTFSTYKGKIRHFNTLMNLGIRELYKDIGSFDASKYDIVLSDFEPLSSRIASRYNIPSVGVGHQYAFLSDIPKAGSNFLANLIISRFAPVDFPIGLHWYHFNQPIFPPVVPRFLGDDPICIRDKILVYLPFEELDDIVSLLKPFKDQNFFVYHRLENPDYMNNIKLCPYSRTGFLRDLMECKGVISNAGFELVSEALALGKKLLLKPLAGQMEQLSNALVINNLKLGLVMYKLEKAHVEKLLDKPPAAPINYPYVAETITEAIDSGEWANINNFVKRSWEHICLP